MKEIIVPRNNSVYQTLVILTPIALFFCLRFLHRYYYSAEVQWAWVILFLLLSGFSFYLLFFSIQKIRNPLPALRINKAGLEDNISMVKPGLLRWENISGSAIVKYTGSDHLLIYLKAPESVLPSLNYFQQKMAQQMIDDLQTPIAINPKLIRYDVKKLNEVINKKSPRKNKKPSR